MININVGFLQWFINFLIKKRLVKVLKNKIFLMKNLRKNYTSQVNERNMQSPFIDNTWGADLADMQLINKFNKRFTFSLCVIDSIVNMLRLIL